MKKYKVFCYQCGKEYQDQWWLCPACGGSLEVAYAQTLDTPQFPTNIFIESLGEGNTPLIRLSILSKKYFCDLWAKCEMQNPTGSFKDRGSVIEIAKALELGMSGIVCASTGNMAASLAAYATRIGLRCIVVIPVKTPISKLQQAVICGAELIKVQGAYDECVKVAKKIAQQKKYFLCGDYLLRREGQKTLGWELANSCFDAFIIPVGNGNIGLAVAKGISEFIREKNLPQFVGVQSTQVNPLEKAWVTRTEIFPVKNRNTIASACNVGNPLDGAFTLDVVKKTRGCFVAATDKEILTSQDFLAKNEGLYVEATAASTLAGFIKIRKQFRNKKVVLILTGSGLKERK
ncbi:MAG: threonine synthase [Candidatus Pacebacteria bacterium]|nr:threonine synthase [Candidatus Paceibacterota bacterium]